MRRQPTTRVAAGALATLALCTLTAATQPAAAGTSTTSAAAAATEADLTPAAGSSKVRTVGSGVELAATKPAASAAKLRQRTGFAVLAPLRLDDSVSAVEVTYRAVTPRQTTAEVDVRTRADGAWAQWTPAADGEVTDLLAPSREVQLRVALSAPAGVTSPRVSNVEVAEASASKHSAERSGPPVSSKVYATREGLAGGTTANGHEIAERDHFVALPSRRGLSAKGSGEYSVQACRHGRCIWEPVWDIGPWNTKDDYWNPSSEREMWRDLPQGKAQARAAHEDGYNDGKDQYDREVSNAAGIDIADGAFWDGLQMSDNGWVDVVYQWTGNGTYGTVALDSGYLNVRSGAGTNHRVAGMAGDTARIPLKCQVTGQSVTGSQGTSTVWYRVNDGMYVAKAWIKGASVEPC
ncbi:MAG: hypothetical protein GEV07_13610 [Streptosporangiales bacterium]|nr:hypothetical protein [Streptosporangiales bacterium]